MCAVGLILLVWSGCYGKTVMFAVGLTLLAWSGCYWENGTVCCWSDTVSVVRMLLGKR